MYSIIFSLLILSLWIPSSDSAGHCVFRPPGPPRPMGSTADMFENIRALSQCKAFHLHRDHPNIGKFKVKPPSDPNPDTVPTFISSPNHKHDAEFLSEVMQILLQDGVFFNENRTVGPYDFKTPEELTKLMPDLSVGDGPTPHAQLLKIVHQVVKYSPHAGHPYMLDKRVAGLDPYGLAADWLANTMSNLVVLYIVAPIYTIMEREMASVLGGLMQWRYSQGVSTSGAGAGHGLAVAMAMQAKWPDLKEKGLVGVGNPKPAIFVSEHASYAFDKAQAYSGLAEEWLIKIATEPKTGRMDMKDLREQIAKAKADGLVPIMVVGTAGTPLLGAIDDLNQIAAIAVQEQIWFHVDAERGGGCLFGRFDPVSGIANADSVLFSGWMFATPYVSSFIMTKRENMLFIAFSLHASYVWTGIDLYDHGKVDTGDFTIQTSRRPEIAKFWFTWKARGSDNLREHQRLVYANTAAFVQLLKSHGNGAFILATETHDMPQVAFNYIPTTLRSLDKSSGEYRTKLDDFTRKIKIGLLKSNILQLSIGDLGEEQPLVLIVTLTNSILTQPDLEYIVKTIAHFGEQVAKGGALSAGDPPPPLDKQLYKSRRWVTTPVRAEHQQFYVDTLQTFLKRGIFFSRTEKPTNFLQPDVLRTKWDFKLGPLATPHKELLHLFNQVIDYSPHWAHPYFIYQLAAGLDPYTLAADYVASAMQTPMVTYEDSPVFTLMQNEVLKAFRQAIFKSPDGDGTFTDGGSMANQLPIAIARHRKDAQVKKQGIGYADKKFVLYVSEDGHYSTRKGAIVQGLGGDNSIHVVANDIAQMDMVKLEDAIKKTIDDGDIPFMITLTVGTTIFGGIDNVQKGVELCQKYQLWCHVDGMFGGMLAISDKQRHRAAGLEQVDSYGVDLHKLMGSTMVMSALVTRHKDVFKKTFETGSPIDYSTRVGGAADGFYDKEKWDLGDSHWQLDKRNNLFKFWFLWKAKGRIGMAQHVDRIYDNSAYLVSELHRRPGFTPVIKEFEVTNICFFYSPPLIRRLDQKSNEWKVKQSQVSFLIEKSLVNDNVISIVSQRRYWNEHNSTTATFIKFVMMGSELTRPDINYLLDTIEYYGNQIKSLSKPQRRSGSVEEPPTEPFDPFGNNPMGWREAHQAELRRVKKSGGKPAGNTVATRRNG